MTTKEIVNKLIGNINPVGETNTDDERFENLIQMCELVGALISQIDDVRRLNEGRDEFSLKRASDFAAEFLFQILGIEQ